MDKQKIERMMENMDPPEVDVKAHKQLFKLYLLNTRKASIWGVLLLIIPFFFIVGAIAKYRFQFPIWPFSAFTDWVISIDPDSDRSLISWSIRFLLVGTPVIAVVLNVLSIMDIYYNKVRREFAITVRLKWINWLMIALGIVIFIAFLGVLLVENVGHG